MSGQPNAAIGWEFDAIIAVVLGGVSIKGGSGNVIGVFFGALISGLLTNGMTLLDVSSYWQQVVKGIVLALAIGFEVSKNRRINKS